MDLLDHVLELEIDSPTAGLASPLRLLTIGKYLQLGAGSRAIDLGCGRGEMLCLWARYLESTGVGVDTDRSLLADAIARAERWGVSGKIEFDCMDMAQYEMADGAFDVVACMSASMGFGGFRPTIRHLRRVVSATGSLVVAEPFYSALDVPSELREYEGDCHTEMDLLNIARAEGLEIGYYSRATRDEWDRYIFSSRRSGMQELLAMPSGPAREDRRAGLHRWQDMYIRYRQHWQGMAFMTLHPV